MLFRWFKTWELGVKTLLIMCDGEGNLGDSDDKKRTTSVENHYKWVEAAKELGCHSIRVNAASDRKLTFAEQQMLAADPKTGDLRRFLTGPVGCEITGITETPDGRTLFVNIQHPEGSSTWPNINGETRPRSATLVITKDDGGIVGT